MHFKSLLKLSLPKMPFVSCSAIIKGILDYFKFFPVTVSWRAFVYLLKPFLQVSLHSDTFVSHRVRSTVKVLSLKEELLQPFVKAWML